MVLLLLYCYHLIVNDLFYRGNGENGLLCNNDDSFSDQYIPKKVSFIKNIIKDIQFGDSHCLALTGFYKYKLLSLIFLF